MFQFLNRSGAEIVYSEGFVELDLQVNERRRGSKQITYVVPF